MPLITFYASKRSIPAEEKRQLVKRVTALYTSSMPAFYVVIVFKDLEAGDFFVGGHPVDSKFVRITFEHLAIHFEDVPRPDAGKSFLDRASSIFTDMWGGERGGMDYELHVVESPRELWRINGLVPPPSRSDEERVWMEENKVGRWAGDGFEGVESILKGT